MTTTHGYTLLEIMVALAVFAILSTITAATMIHSFDIRARVNIQSDQLNATQVALTLIARDIEQMVDRPVIGTEMHLFPAFIGASKYIEFTRGGAVNPEAVEHRSTLKRIALICGETKLIRRTWDRLDAPTRKSYQDKILLDNLKTCSFAYLNHFQKILPEWRNEDVLEHQKQETLPTAVQFNLTLQTWGNMSLLFSVPEALYGTH